METASKIRQWRRDPDAETILRDVANVDFTIEQITLDEIDWAASANNCARLDKPLNEEKIDEYSSGFARNDVFPMIVCERSKNGKYTILGGNQRCAGLKRVDQHASVSAYIVNILVTAERELIIRSLNSRHGWGSTKEERIEHAVLLVRKYGLSVETIAKAMAVGASTIDLRIRAENERQNLADIGIDASVIPRNALTAIANIKDQSAKVKIATLAASKNTSGEKIADLCASVVKSKSKADSASVIADFAKNVEVLKEIKGSKLKKPRREKFLKLLGDMVQFLEHGADDGSAFYTLDQLTCSVVHDLDNVRVLSAKITSRLQCICESGR